MLNANRQSHAGSYEVAEESGTSRFTYEHGVKAVHGRGQDQNFCSGDGNRVLFVSSYFLFFHTYCEDGLSELMFTWSVSRKTLKSPTSSGIGDFTAIVDVL